LKEKSKGSPHTNEIKTFIEGSPYLL